MVVNQPAPDQALLAILGRRQGEANTLSTDLFSWSVSLLQAALRGDFQNEGEALQVLAAKTDALRALLWDPFGERPIQTSPVFDGKRVWEKAIYQDCRTCCCGLSPFDSQRMPEKLPAHGFARELVHWARLYLPRWTALAPETPHPMIALSDPYFAEFKQLAYKKIAQGIVFQERIEEVCEEIRQWLEQADFAIAQIQKEADTVIAEAELGIERSREELLQRIGWVEKNYQETAAQFQSQKEQMEKTFEGLLNQVQAERAAKQQADQETIRSVDKRIDTLKEEWQKGRSEYEQKFYALEQARVQAVDSLRAQIAAAKQGWKTEADAVQRQHQETVFSALTNLTLEKQQSEKLRQEIGQMAYRRQELESQYRAQSWQIDQQADQLQNLRAQMDGLPGRSSTRVFGINF